MPKKKQQINGFSVYMDELMPQLRREGRVFPNGKQDLVPIAQPRWKVCLQYFTQLDKAKLNIVILPVEEKVHYDTFRFQSNTYITLVKHNTSLSFKQVAFSMF